MSYKVQAPFTATWKSEEALTEIDAFRQRLDQIRAEVAAHEVEKYVEGFAAKVKELSENLTTLFVIWNIVIEWENFERNVHGQKIQVGAIVLEKLAIKIFRQTCHT